MKNSHAVLLFWMLTSIWCHGQQQMVDNTKHHLRNGQPREWSEFPIETSETELLISFPSTANKLEQTISFRQYDVKQEWRILLNKRDIGSLATDEKDMITYYSIPAGILRDGSNELQIKCAESMPDDIRVSEIRIDTRPLTEVLSEASVEIQIFDKSTH